MSFGFTPIGGCLITGGMPFCSGGSGDFAPFGCFAVGTASVVVPVVVCGSGDVTAASA